jgi:hypothetical protein
MMKIHISEGVLNGRLVRSPVGSTVLEVYLVSIREVVERGIL